MMDLRDKNDIRVVEKEINGHVDYYASLIDELNVSGYDNVPAILLYYAPALLNNACSYFKRKVVENPIKEALRSCLPFMQRIINDVRDKMVNNGNGVITVMLRDAAILAAEDPSQLESFTINILGDNEVVVKKQLTI